MSEELRVQPGVYRAEFGTEFPGFEAELILGFDGSYRWFGVRDHLAMAVFRGLWSGAEDQAVFDRRESSFLYYNPEFFTDFTAAPADTALIRSLGRDGFEKYELAPDGKRGMWVGYQRTLNWRVFPGKYVFRDTVFFPDTAGNVDTAYLRREFDFRKGAGAGYREFQNDTPRVDVEIPTWTQAGSFVISSGPRHRYYVDSLGNWADWADTLEGEWIFRVQESPEPGFLTWDWYDGNWLNYRWEP